MNAIILLNKNIIKPYELKQLSNKRKKKSTEILLVVASEYRNRLNFIAFMIIKLKFF